MRSSGAPADGADKAKSSEQRVELARALGDLMRDMTLESDRLAHRFAHHHELHATDFRALTLIYTAEQQGKPLSPSKLAAMLSLSSGAVTYLVERLVSSGHVTRADDPTDRRRVILRYALHGHETASAYFVPLGMHIAKGLAEFDDESLRTARDVLRAMHEAMTTFDDE
ncbi:MarR family winged helix-turn-helix transcriptional regulator [Mobilicoccus caccae]|uniref:HTH marR-type domain-containing protein n=1 Tax=Mobilicoccus caccae TaxID=1859295 RepID=A0ABQ6IKM1_9MICO|nr:MarR family transcriptional regulator [Mobilicoccus caccae]GMA38420.1 hypothetical protein GCM10025883_04650 [Mobilicoccus caccae]